MEALHRVEARSVADLGCGEGRLLAQLIRERSIARIVGVDASMIALERVSRRLKLDRAEGSRDERLTLLHGALTYCDGRIGGMDAVTLVEVIEHLDPDHLPARGHVVFGEARPRHVFVTAPNVEYNALFPAMPAGKLRHPDDRFEWTRAEFADWAGGIEVAYGYRAEASGIGTVDETHGAPTQVAVFSR